MYQLIFQLFNLYILLMCPHSPPIFSEPKLSVDVCIVGGGIAGNFLAYQLRKRTISCAVVEEHTELGKPFQCAGIMSQKLLKLAPFPKSLILNRVHIAQIIAPNGDMIEMAGKEHPVIIDRVGFDAYFGMQAQAAGAIYLLGERYLTHYGLKSGHALVITSKRKISCKLVVGADGPYSRVAARLGIKNQTIPAYQVRARMPYDPHKTMMHFDPKWRELFGYVVPEGVNGICRIGLATKSKPKVAMEHFLKYLNVTPSQIVDEQGGVIPYGFPRRFAFRNTILLGDAAVMVKATTGGGVVMLLSAAKILTETIARSLATGDYSEAFLKKSYEHPVKRTLGLELKLHYFIRLLLVRLKRQDFNRFFRLYYSTDLKDIIHQFADMDFPLRLFKKLLQNRHFIRFMLHIAFRNWTLIPHFLHDIAL
jgi:geranylgeranyl reductase family protein